MKQYTASIGACIAAQLKNGKTTVAQLPPVIAYHATQGHRSFAHRAEVAKQQERKEQ